MSLSRTLCPLPWLSLSMESTRRLRFCCHETGEIPIVDAEGASVNLGEVKNPREVLNLNAYQALRAQMLRGERPNPCSSCFKLEDLSGHSPRLEYLESFKAPFEKILKESKEDEYLSDPKVFYLDLTVDNECNLKCRMCSPRYSKKLGKDWEEMRLPLKNEGLDLISTEKTINDLEDSKILETIKDDVSLITMTGGEPFLSKASRHVIKEVSTFKRVSDISLRFYTNTTVFPEDLKLDLEKFKKVNIFCSIDGFGETSNYIRYPSRWGNIEKIFKKLVRWSEESPQIEVGVHTVLQAYNITQLIPLMNFFKSFDGAIPAIPSFTILETPKLLRPSILPQDVLKKAHGEVQSFLERNSGFLKKHHALAHEREALHLMKCFDDAIKENESNKFLDFILHSKKYDGLRKQSLLDFYPEFFQEK